MKERGLQMEVREARVRGRPRVRGEEERDRGAAASRRRGEVAKSVDDGHDGRKMGGRGLEAQSGGGVLKGVRF